MTGSGQPGATSIVAHMEFLPSISMADHLDGAMHHSAAAHCIGCGIEAPLYSFWARSVEHSKTIPFVQMLAHSVQLLHFRPPIAPLD